MVAAISKITSNAALRALFMSLREFFVLCLVCLIWGMHFVVMKLAMQNGVEPIFYAAIRISIVTLILLPKLKWHAGMMKRIMCAGLCFGGINYAFMFSGIEMTTASAAAITIELYVPFSIILSVIFLRERLGLPRIVGIALAFVGVIILSSAKPPEEAGVYFLLGIGLIACAAMAEAIGAVLVKTIKQVGPLQLLAWFVLMGNFVLWPLTLTLETNQLDIFHSPNLGKFLFALAYSTLLASLVGHASYYWLLQRLPISIVSSVGLMTTVVAVTASILILKEPISAPLFIGAACVLIGVAMILLIRKTAPANGQIALPVKDG